MMSNNKILTVSYGTFSCTLEGFDDSFGTMKAIAEYFRDLASDDRYFGAEPPQPDAEMLSRIAQKEISRRVEVREHEGKIVISATDADHDAEAAALIELDVDVQAEIARAAQDETDAQAEIARVQLKAAQAKELADAEAARIEEARIEQVRLEKIRLEEDARLEAETKVETPELVARDLAAELPEAEAFFATKPQDSENAKITTTPIAEDVTPIAPQEDSIAAKLQRIRAVVSQAEMSSDDDDFSEDEHAEEFGAEVVEVAVIETAVADDFGIADFSVDTPEVIQTETAQIDVKEDAIADIQAASDADAIADAVEDANTAEMVDDDMSSILARLEGHDPDVVAADVVEDFSEDTLDEEVDDFADTIAEANSVDEETPSDDENLFDDSVYGDDDSVLNDDFEDDGEPLRIARVIKVKRADLEAAITKGDLEEIEEDTRSSTLSDEEEDELARDLADVEAEFTDLKNDIDGETLFEDATFEDSTASSIQALPEISDNVGDDLSRLLAEVDQQMEDEEGKQSRDAFAHLRAAVAAKNADSGLAEPTVEEEEVAYRSDLATVVKPRRPASGTGRSERPTTTARPAPLKLVAEQRVDAPEMDPRGPVRPRRVALQEAAKITGSGNFVEFAEDVGATELPDLLEAAAAYMSFVEGREQFSRPQLMNHVRQVEKENFSREDGLRSFGQLLRSGKIEKIKGGRFTVTGDIGYRPDARAAS